jgi:hypothetical protein
MSPFRFLLSIHRLMQSRLVGHPDLWVSQTWLSERQYKEFDIGRRQGVPTDLSALVSERLSLRSAEPSGR